MTQDLSYVHPNMINPALNATTILLDPNDPSKGTLADVITALQGAIRAKADLDKIGGVVVDAQLPPLGEVTTITRPDAASMYGADLQGGDLCVRSDEGDSLYMLLRRPAAVAGNWQKIWSPDNGVNPAATAWVDLTDTPNTITPHMVVKGNAAGTGLTQGVMKTSEIVNDSTGTGSTLKDALDSLNNSNSNAVSQADLNTALADKADATDLAGKADANHTHDASELNNDSSVAGAKISDALDKLKTDLDAVPDTADVTALQTAMTHRRNDITALQNAMTAKADDNHSHDASELNNDSNVTGATIRDALNNIQTMMTAGMTPKGGFDASTNTPALSNGSGADSDMYWVTTSGTLSPAVDGITDLDVGDIVFAADGKWIRVGREDDVSSVFGRKGAVIAQAGDYDGNQITNDSNVTGSTVREALNNLQADLDDTPDTADVTSQINNAVAGKANSSHGHDASALNNDSTVTGAKVSNALDNLNNQVQTLAANNNDQGMTSINYMCVGIDYTVNTGTYNTRAINYQKITVTAPLAINLNGLINTNQIGWPANASLAGTANAGHALWTRFTTVMIDNSANHAINLSVPAGVKLIAPGGNAPNLTGKCRVNFQAIEYNNGDKEIIVTKIDDGLQEVV